MIENELSRYGGLEDRPRLVALNKIDVPDGRDLADIVLEDLQARGLRVIPVSAASGEGLRELTFAMAGIVEAALTSKTCSPRPRSSSTTMSAMSWPSGTSTLLRATSRGRSSRPP